MPQVSGAPYEAIVLSQLQSERHRGLSDFARHSNEITRTIRSTRISSRAR